MNIVEKAREVLSQDKLVLIVGVIPRSLENWHNVDDPNLLIWTLDNHGKNVPAHTGLVLRTDKVQHQTTISIKRQLPNGATLYPKPLRSRDIKDLLQTVWGPRLKKSHAPAERSESMSMTPTQPQPQLVTVPPAAPEAPTSASPEVNVVESDAVKFIENLTRSLAGVKEALEGVLRQNSTLESRVHELEGVLTEKELECEVYAGELSRATQEKDSLKAQLSETQKRAEKAEATLAEKMGAIQSFMQLLQPGPSSS